MLQSSEGGSVSVGNRRFRLKRSVTPPLTSVTGRTPEGLPVAMPADMLTERMPPRARSSRFSTLAAATDKITISRNVLFGLCLTTFALGIVTTLSVDHMHARASEATASRETEPVVLQTSPIEPAAKPAPAPAVPAPPPPSSSPAIKPQVAAAGAVVVQLPSVAERSSEKVAGKMAARLAPATPLRSARLIAAAPVKAPTTAPHKRTSASGSSSPKTEAAPDEARTTRAPTQKKWVDPFDQ